MTTNSQSPNIHTNATQSQNPNPETTHHHRFVIVLFVNKRLCARQSEHLFQTVNILLAIIFY